jgi:hypothetical protein
MGEPPATARGSGRARETAALGTGGCSTRDDLEDGGEGRGSDATRRASWRILYLGYYRLGACRSEGTPDITREPRETISEPRKRLGFWELR